MVIEVTVGESEPHRHAATCGVREAVGAGYWRGAGSSTSGDGHRGGGVPNAFWALATIFLPMNRLPTPPTTAPTPTGSILSLIHI